MPGTILLDDLRSSIEDQLHQHVQGLLDQASQAAQQVVQPVQAAAGLVQQLPQIQTPDPGQVQQVLLQHVNSITQPVQQAAAPALQVLGGAQQQAGGALTELGGQAQQVHNALQAHVDSLTNGGLQSLGVPPQQQQALGGGQPSITTVGGQDQAATPDQTTVSTPPDRSMSLQDYARAAAQRAGIDPGIFVAQIQQESGFNPQAKSGAGALGIAQFMPQTAQGMNVDPTDPYAALDAAARLDAQNLKKYDGDYQKTLAAYNAGGGAVDQYGGVPPFQETQRYVRSILDNAKNAVGGAVQAAGARIPGPVGGAIQEAGRDISQFGDTQLTSSEAYAACGPAAAVRFAERFGRNPTLREATDLAKQVGWTQDSGMAGLGSEQKLMTNLGIDTKIVGRDWSSFAKEAQTGNPVTISTPGHYFYADAYNAESGAFHVGRSGLDLKGGSEWMTPSQMENLMGTAQGALFSNNPNVPAKGSVTTSNEAPALINLGSRPQAKPPLVFGGMQDASGQVVADQQQGPTPIQTAQDALGSAAGAIGSAVGQVASDLGSAAQGALGAISEANRATPGTAAVQAVQGAVQQATAPVVLGPGQESARDQVGRTVQNVVPVLGGVASDIGTSVRGVAQDLGGAVSNAYGLNKTPEQQQADYDKYQQDVQAAAEEMNRRSQQPITPGSTVGGAWDLIIGANPPMGISLKQYQDDQQAKNLWIEQNNPLRDMTVVGGITTGIAQQLTDPLMLATFGPSVGAGRALGAGAARGVTAALGERLSPRAVEFASTVADKLASGAFIGGVQNALMEAEKPDATPESVFTALWQGAAFGGGADLGAAALTPVALRIGQTLIDRAPELQAALRNRQPAQVQVNAALGGAPEAAARVGERLGRPAEEAPGVTPAATSVDRTPITEGGLGTPRYDYPTGTTPQVIADGLRQAAEQHPTGVAHVDGPTLGAMPSLPRPSTPDAPVPAWQQGISPHLDDLRYAQDVGMNQSQWYSKFAQSVAQVVGDKNVNEFRTLFGITSQQTAPTENLQYTLGLMRMAREFTANGTDFTVNNIKNWIADNPRVTSLGTEGAKWKMNTDQFKKVAQLYTTGEVKVATNAKTSSYASNILSALLNRFDPNSTMDTWMAQIFNYKNPNRTASSDQAFQAMRTVVDHLAGETGQVPHQAQAAMWFAIKGAKDFAASKAASPVLKAMVKDFTNGRATLRQVLDKAGSEGAYANPTGTWEQVAADRGVASELAKLQPHLAADAPRPAIADSSYLYYPGKGTPIKGASTIAGRAPRTSGVVPETTMARAAQAERQAGVAQAEIPQAAADRLGYDPETRQFAELRGVPHEVQGDQVLVPGGNMDTLRYVAAKIHEASGADATPATLYTYRPESPEHVGWEIVDIPADRRVALLDDLHAAGIGYQELHGGTIGVNALPVGSDSYEQALGAAVTRAGAQTEELFGRIQTVSPADAQSTLSQYGARYGAADVGGLSEPGRGVADTAAGFRTPGNIGQFFNPSSRARGEATPAFGVNLAGAAVGGAAGNAATPEDAPLDVRLRNIGLGATAGLLGTHAITRGGGLADAIAARAEARGAAPIAERGGFRAPGEGDLRATLQEPPSGAGREPPPPRSISDVVSNPHTLREAGVGDTPMTADELSQHTDDLSTRYEANAARLQAIDELLRNPGSKPERPPWAGGFSNDQVAEMAAKVGRSAYEPLWWEKAGLETGSGEVHDLITESGIQRGMGQREPTPADLRREAAQLTQEQRHLEVAGEQVATAPGDARLVRQAQQPADLPLAGEHATEQARSSPGALAEDIVTQNGHKDYGSPLTEGPGEVVGRKGRVTGRGISDVEAANVGPPSEDTLRRMPNLDAMLKGQMPEVRAQIQRAAEDNPELFDAYTQGRISHDSLVSDLATKVGMTREQWLKTPVGKGFNTEEMVALQAAAIDGQARSTQMAHDIVARGGVDALTPEQVAYGLNELVSNAGLLTVARGGRTTAGRTLNALKIRLDAAMAGSITASNERLAAQRAGDAARRVAARAGDLIKRAAATDKEKVVAVAGAKREGAPKNIIDQIAAAYDELDRYNAMSLHEKADVFDKLKAERDAAAAARKAAVRGAPEELLSALKQELKAEQDNFAKRKSTWETMAFQDEKAFGNMMDKRTAFRGGLYIETQRKSANLAAKVAEADAKRAFDLESKRQSLQSQKASTLLEAVGGAKPSRELLDAYVKAVTSDDPLAAGKFVKGLMDPGWVEAQILRIAGLLSSTVTHMANTVGNISQVPLEVATHATVVPIDWARAKATGGQRVAYMAELGPMLEGYGPGFAAAMPDAIKILQTGVTPENAVRLENIRPGFASGSGKVDTAVEMPLRALQAEDQLFRGGAFGMQAKRVATRYAYREGFRGDELAGRTDNIIKNLENYPELYSEAHAAMLRMVFQEHRDWIPSPRGAAAGVVSQPLPFIKTPANITAQGFGLSPLGIAGSIEAVKARGALEATGKATGAQLDRATLLAEQRVARTAIGTAILGMGVGLGAGTFSGGTSMLTGAYDPNEASTYPQGWREWSMVTPQDPITGNTYYVPLQNFGAAGAPLAMAAILTDAAKRGHSLLDKDEAARAATSIGQYVLDNTFLQGLSDTVNVLHDPSRYANKFLESLASSYGPYSAMGRQIQRAYGVASRNPHDGLMGLVEAMESNYPGLSGNVPESLTAIGEPREQGISGAAAFALPVRADILRDEPTLRVLRDNDVRIPPPAKAINVGGGWAIDLSPEEQDQVQRARGEELRRQVAGVMDSPLYKNGDISVRNELLSKAVSAASQNSDVLFTRALSRADIQSRAVRKTVPTPYTVAGESAA